MFAGIAVLAARDRTNPKRIGNAAFWGLLALSFLFGSKLGDVANGLLVLALVLLAGTRALARSVPHTTSPRERAIRAETHRSSLFVPVLLIPALAITGSLTLGGVSIAGVRLVEPGQATLISLALAFVLALVVAVIWLRPPALAALEEGRRLTDTIGWAIILPQMLAALGAVFALSGVGGAVGRLSAGWLPVGQPFGAVAAYCIGMAVFTMIMGNAFAAFPVMTAAIGVPLIVQKFGGDAAVVGAIGMLCGYCGTLATPMAANFNIVPAALLELPDRNAVIKAQIPTALPLLIANILLMYFLAFRF